MLTVDNIDAVADLIRRTLEDKTYTFVAVNEGRNYEPDVDTGRTLRKDGVDVARYESGGASIFVHDSWGVLPISAGVSDDYDPDVRRGAYVVVTLRQVSIKHRAPIGHLLYWSFTLERERRS